MYFKGILIFVPLNNNKNKTSSEHLLRKQRNKTVRRWYYKTMQVEESYLGLQPCGINRSASIFAIENGCITKKKRGGGIPVKLNDYTIFPQCINKAIL